MNLIFGARTAKGFENADKAPAVTLQACLGLSVPACHMLALQEKISEYYLWNKIHYDFDAIVELLANWGKDHGWTVDNLQAWGAEEIGYSAFLPEDINTVPAIPSSQIERLWQHGALCWSAEYGLELHPAGQAILCQREEIKYRIWRGQARFMIPKIENLRLHLCRYLSMRYGSNWPVKWDTPDDEKEYLAVKQTPMACGWGHMDFLIKNSQPLANERILSGLISVAKNSAMILHIIAL